MSVGNTAQSSLLHQEQSDHSFDDSIDASINNSSDTSSNRLITSNENHVVAFTPASAAISVTSPEIYFLIWKFLSASPCSTAANALANEINQKNLLPKRLDWQGNVHEHTLESYSRLFSFVKPDHLTKLVANETNPFESWPVVPTNRSLLRSISPVNHRKHVTNSRILLAHVSGNQVIQSYARHHNSSYSLALTSQPYQGPIGFSNYVSSQFYSKFVMHRRLLGHLSLVYCVCFDRTGRYIITGADDLLVKIWSAIDGRLISTLRGHSAEITDISISHENTILATGSVDKHIRIWCLRTTAPICVLTSHQQQITSVKFCPLLKNNIRYLVTTSKDGSICFWKVNVTTNCIDPKPLKFIERPKPGAHIVCSSFSTGGAFLATGSTDHYIRVFHVDGPSGPVKILEIEAHSDHVDSLVFSNWSLRFISGSKDGHAHIWYYERQSWKNLTLDMSEKPPNYRSVTTNVINTNQAVTTNQSPANTSGRRTRTIATSNPVNIVHPTDDNTELKKIKVNMVGWSCDDKYVITTASDRSIRVWDSRTGKLIHCLWEHDDDAFVIEAHPTDGRIVLTAGHDGKVVIWDIVDGLPIKVFTNEVDGQGHGAILDLKMARDGRTFAAVDSHAHVMIFGLGTSKQYEKVPPQVFFHTDYRPLVRDVNNYVIDEQTQCPPHLMPPPFLVDIDGNPHPPIYQRLVPGRENCNDEQLVPHIAVHNERGVNEILQPVNEHLSHNNANANPNLPVAPVSAIDAMIERLEADRLARLAQPSGASAASLPSLSQPQQPQPSSSASTSTSAASASASTSTTAPAPAPAPAAALSPQPSSSSLSNRNMPSNVSNRRVNENSNRRRLNSIPANEGVRSTSGNWQTLGGFASIGNSSVWGEKRPAVRPLPECELRVLTNQILHLARAETEYYTRESKKHPLVVPTISPRALINPKEKFTRRKKRLTEQRQGLRVSHPQNNNPASRGRVSSATVRRHMLGYLEEDNEELLNAMSDQSSHAMQSGAESWSENDTSESESSDESSEESSDDSSSCSDAGSGSDGEYNGRNARRSKRLQGSSRQHSSKSWQKLCKHLIEEIWQLREAVPFRFPVDQMEYPDYARLIDTPMDLSSLREQLAAGQYENMREFKHDLDLIFKNSRVYNTDKTSQIFKWTTKLMKVAEEKMSQINSNLRKRSRTKQQGSADRTQERRSVSRNDARNTRESKSKAPTKSNAAKTKPSQQGKKGKTKKKDKGKRIVKRKPAASSDVSSPNSKPHVSTATTTVASASTSNLETNELEVQPGPSRISDQGSSSSSSKEDKIQFLKSLVTGDDDDEDTVTNSIPNPYNSETEIEDVHSNTDSDATELAEPCQPVSVFDEDTDISSDAIDQLKFSPSDHADGGAGNTEESPMYNYSTRSGPAKRKRPVRRSARCRKRTRHVGCCSSPLKGEPVMCR